ncbi:MAG TPA: TonB-dependent siderophore receptor [Candidatus Kapabacteria bacterium]
MKVVNFYIVSAFFSFFALANMASAQTKKDSVGTYEAEEITISEDKDAYFPKVSYVGAKTNTPLRDIPASISVIPLPLMKEQGVINLDQSIRNVSGVTQSSSSNYGFFNKYNIRGLSSRFLLNGLPDGSTVNGYARSLTGIDHIEVLKGPGSALYGGGETGGTVNMVSKPLYSNPGVNFTQTAGSYGAFTSMVDVGTGVDDGSIKSRLSANFTQRDGYRDIKNKTMEVIPTASFNVGPGVLSATADFRSIDQVADSYGIPLESAASGATVIDVPFENKYYTPFGTTETRIQRGYLSYNYVASEDFTVRTNTMIAGRTLHLLRNAGSASTANSDTIKSRQLREQWDDVSEALVQIEPVFYATTGSLKHTVLGGFEYNHGNIYTFRQTAPLPNIVDRMNPVVPESSYTDLKFTKNAANDRHILVSNIGLYAQEQMTISDQFKVRAGGRYDMFGTNDMHLSDTNSTDTVYNTFSYQLGAVYQPIEEVSIFGGYSLGYQSTLSTEGTSAARPESANQLELGVKTSFMDNTLNVNVTWFDVHRKDFIVTINGEPEPVGEQKTSGIETDVAVRLFDNLTITGNFALYSAELLSLGTADSLNVGKQPTGVPEQSAGTWVAYTFSQGILKGLGLGAGATFRGDMFFNTANTITVPGYTTLDAGLFYKHQYFDAQVNIANLTDQKYFRNGANSGFFPGDPRNVTATIRLKF